MASSGIEPESGASETLILSIVRRGQKFHAKSPRGKGSYSFFFGFVPYACLREKLLIAAKIIEPSYCCFNSSNKRSVSSFLHSSVPEFIVAAVPAATP